MVVRVHLGLMADEQAGPRDVRVFQRAWYSTVPQVGTYIAHRDFLLSHNKDPRLQGTSGGETGDFVPSADALYLVRWQCLLPAVSIDGTMRDRPIGGGFLLGVIAV